jgi:histidine ammonia-lyase
LDYWFTDYDESGQAYVALSDHDISAHMPVVLETRVQGHVIKYALVSGHAAMRLRELEPLVLDAKEGLAFNNGASFSAALASLALYDAENVARHAEIATALSLEALLGFRDAYLPHIHQLRRQPGQAESAARIRQMLDGSTLVEGDADRDPHPLRIPPQDAYSLRVAPQVLGAVWDVLAFVRSTLTAEINAATDNPLIFPDGYEPRLDRDYRVVSGGNFHGTPIGYAMDFLRIVMTDLGSLCERRVFRLTDPHLNRGLPCMLIADRPDQPGLTSGLMIAQYLAASLVSDCRTLAHPDSVDSIPTSANQEDHVSMSMNAARHTRQVVENVEYIVAIELLCSALALDRRLADLAHKLRAADSLQHRETDYDEIDVTVLRLRQDRQEPRAGQGSRAALDTIEQWLYRRDNALPALGKGAVAVDRYLRPYLLRVTELLKSGELVERIYRQSGLPLPGQMSG